MSISAETKSRVVSELLAIEAKIESMELATPHDALPPEYDALIVRRDAARRLLRAE